MSLSASLILRVARTLIKVSGKVVQGFIEPLFGNAILSTDPACRPWCTLDHSRLERLDDFFNHVMRKGTLDVQEKQAGQRSIAELFLEHTKEEDF